MEQQDARPQTISSIMEAAWYDANVSGVCGFQPLDSCEGSYHTCQQADTRQDYDGIQCKDGNTFPIVLFPKLFEDKRTTKVTTLSLAKLHSALTVGP